MENTMKIKDKSPKRLKRVEEIHSKGKLPTFDFNLNETDKILANYSEKTIQKVKEELISVPEVKSEDMPINPEQLEQERREFEKLNAEARKILGGWKVGDPI